MSMQAALKAGGIGAGVMVLLALLGLIPIPFLGCLCCLLVLGVWIGDGVLAVYFMPTPRTSGGAAGTGAVAGLISGVGYGLVSGIASIIRAATGVASAYITPEMIQQLQDAGIDPQTFSLLTGTAGGVLAAGLCCVTALVLGAGLGALGGVIGAAVLKKEPAVPSAMPPAM
jgi:hypothetical protein